VDKLSISKWFIIILLSAILAVVASSLYIYEYKHEGSHLHKGATQPPPFENLVVDFKHAIMGHDPEQVVCYREAHRNFYLFTLFLLTSVVGLVAFGFISQRKFNHSLLIKNEEINVQKGTIERSNESLISSIRYARTVQDAFLPDFKQLGSRFSSHFNIYYPKDLLGGDFFWVKQTKNYKIVCVGDCTGHGVPASLMTIIAIGLLNKVVENNPASPGEMLVQVQAGLKDLLAESQIKDGMDLSVCFFAKDHSELHFSGAHQSLLIISKGEITELKGDRLGLGIDYAHLEANFTNQTRQLIGDERFCMYTDGLTDQFGGKDLKKIGKKQWFNWVKETSHLSLENQGETLRINFDDWKGNAKQTDDATMLLFQL